MWWAKVVCGGLGVGEVGGGHGGLGLDESGGTWWVKGLGTWRVRGWVTVGVRGGLRAWVRGGLEMDKEYVRRWWVIGE